jgi:hypothetical protein
MSVTKKKNYLWIDSLLLAALVCTEVGAEEVDDAIQTDRPDFVESSNVVGKGRFQIETSVGYARDSNREERSRTFSLPTLLRIGFSDNWEFRVESDTWLHQRVRERETGDRSTERDWSEYALGLKWHQQDADDKGSPSVGWLFHVDMPSGADSFLTNKFRPSVRMVAEWELPNDYSLGVMPGMIYDVNDQNDRYIGGMLGVVLGKSFTDKFRGFIEFGGQEIKRKKDGGSQLTFDIGVAYLLTDYVQLDAVYNAGLNRYTPDHTFGLGLSAKF